MKSLLNKPALSRTIGRELGLSGSVVYEIMQAVLVKGMRFRFRALGFSMSPFIRNGDVITIAPLSESKPATGKMVAFIHPESGGLTVHRAIGRKGNAYLLHGDNITDHPDGLIPQEEILGCVVSIERDGRRIRLGLGPEGRLIAGLSRLGVLVPFLNRFILFRGLLSGCL